MIRLASQKEAIEIMSEPQIVERIGKMSHHFIYQPFIAYNKDHVLLFVFWETDEDGTYEFHIAVPKNSILSCRVLAVQAMEWLFQKGVKKIITNCPKGKISNMAKKLGLTLTREEGIQHYYEVKSWL